MENIRSILDDEINEPNLQEPLKPEKFQRRETKEKFTYKKLKQEILNEFDNLEKNYKEIEPEILKREFEKLFYKVKTNKRNFNATDFENNDYIVKKSYEALEGCFLTIKVEPKYEITDFEILINEIPNLIYQTFKTSLEQKGGIKLQLYLVGKFHHKIKNQFDEMGIASGNKLILNESNIKNVIRKLIREIKSKIESWESNEAYWQLQNVTYIDFKLREYKPLKGSSYIPTPQKISKTKSIINIKNEDQKCFKYCIIYGLHNDEIKKNPQEIYHYNRVEKKYPNELRNTI